MFMLNDSYRYSVVLLFYFYCTNIITALLYIYKNHMCVYIYIYNDNVFKGYGYFLWLTIFCFYFILTLIVILFYQNGFYYTYRIFLLFYLITLTSLSERKYKNLLN